MTAHMTAFLRSTPAAAHWSAAGIMVIWIMKAVWLDAVDSPYAWMAGLGRVVEGVLSAYIAGYVFFVIFALLPEYRNRVAIAGFLFSKVSHIVGDSSALLMEVEKASGRKLPFAGISGSEVEAAFTATPTSYQPAMIWNGKQAVILDLFQSRKQRSVDTISDLFELGHHLDPKLVSLLHRVKSSPFFGMLNGLPVSNPDLTAWGPSFFKYLNVCRQLRDWYNESRVPGIAPLNPEPV